MIIWPRFILLIIYVNVLWFYYFLARSEEERMQWQYGDGYIASMHNLPMFIPGNPGGRFAHRVFGWIRSHTPRLWVMYGVSLILAICLGFALRILSLDRTTHLTMTAERIAAVSFLSGNGQQLRDLVESAKNSGEVRARLNRQAGWVLVQAARTKASAVHVMIDSGMTHKDASELLFAGQGIKLIFSRQKGPTNQSPFAVGMRWQPLFVAEIDQGRVSHVVDLPEALFHGNPAMPIF